MKQWTVTYRDRSGARTSVIIEAEDRAGVFAELKTRGINAISIAEGVVKAPRRAASGGVSKGVWGLVAAVAVAAIVGVVWMMMPKDEKSKSVVVEEKAPLIVSEGVDKVVESAKPSEVVSTQKVDKVKAGTYRDENGVLRYIKGGARAYDPDRKKKVVNLNVDSKGNPIHRPSPFKFRAEKEIARLIETRPGDAVFGMRRYDARFEADFMASCKEEIVITSDDLPEDVAMKQYMKEVKLEILDRMDKGESLKSILEETRSELQRLSEYKRDVRKTVMDAVSKGEPMTDQEVRLFIDEANKILAEKGLSPITASPIIKAGIKFRSRSEYK